MLLNDKDKEIAHFRATIEPKYLMEVEEIRYRHMQKLNANDPERINKIKEFISQKYKEIE